MGFTADCVPQDTSPGCLWRWLNPPGRRSTPPFCSGGLKASARHAAKCGDQRHVSHPREASPGSPARAVSADSPGVLPRGVSQLHSLNAPVLLPEYPKPRRERETGGLERCRFPGTLRVSPRTTGTHLLTRDEEPVRSPNRRPWLAGLGWRAQTGEGSGVEPRPAPLPRP